MPVPDVSGYAEDIKYSIAIDSIKAEANLTSLAKLIFDIATEVGVSFKSVKSALEDAFTTENVNEISGDITTYLDPAIKKAIASATTLAKSFRDAKAAGDALANMPVNISSPKMVSALGMADSDVQAQVNVAMNQLALKALAERKISQDALNKSDAQAIAITEKLVTSLTERVATEGKVSLANKNIQASSLAEADAKMLALQERMVTAMSERAIAANNVALAEKRIAASQSANNMLFAPAEIEKTAQAVNKTNTALTQTKPAAEKAASGLFSLKNMARTALGTLEAMVIFLTVSFIGNTIKKAIESVSQLEQAFYKLTIAEKSISKAGVDITPAQLDKIASSVTETYATVSKIDSLKMISNLAVLTKDLKLTSAEYAKLAMAIPLVSQQAGVSIDSATEQVITGLTKSGRGWADLGITVDAAIIKQEAINSKIVASAEAYNNLTAEQKQQVEVQALINILEKNTVENLGEQDSYLQTIQGSASKVGVAWENLLTTMGQISRPTIIQGLQVISTWLVETNDYLIANSEQWGRWAGAVSAAMVLVGGALSGRDYKETIQAAYDAMQEAKAMAADFGKTPGDTATGTPPTGGAIEVDDNLQKALEKMNQEILEAQLKLEQDMEDAAIDLGRRLEDITIEYEQKRADAYRDYSSKIADINRSYSNKIADINSKAAESRAKAQADQLEKEREFQNKLQEMREEFLMDMDDALHARDARQILKLIKQYELEKLQAERKHALDMESAAKDEELRQKSFANERAAAERDRKAKLAEAQQDYADKLAKLAADEQAERDAAQLKYEREKQDLEKAMQDRLEIVAANLVNEFNLTQQGLNAIVSLYRQYYQEVAGIYAAMQAMMAGSKAVSSVPYAITTGVKTGGSLSGDKQGKMAQGGTIIADQPTSVIFGEAGVEAATFTPINRTGADVNKLFSNMSGGGGGAGGGNVGIEILLSPDLEARIVSNTLSKTGQVFTKVQRSKR